MKKVLIISDVHNDINTLKTILNKNSDVDIKIFCGDLQNKNLDLLKDFDYIVQGNVEYFKSDKIILTEIEKVNIMITHGDLFSTFLHKIDLEKLFSYGKTNNINLIFFGHSHVKFNKTINNITFFNPGSSSWPRDGNKGSYGICYLDNGKIISLNHHLID